MWSTHMHNIKSLSQKTKQLQPGHKPVIKKAIIWPWGQSSKSNVTKHGMPHIIVRWSTHMPNINSIFRKTNKLQPGHELVIEKAIIWPWGQSSRSQITNHGTRHIVLMWSTHMPNIKSLSHETKTLQPGQDLFRTGTRTEARMEGQTDHYRPHATKRRAPKYFQIMIYIGMLNTLQQLIKGKQPILTDKH